MPDIVDDIESLFNQILGKFNANRPTNSKSRKDVKSGSRLSSESVGALSTTEQSRADNPNQSSENTSRDFSTDETSNGNNQEDKAEIIANSGLSVVVRASVYNTVFGYKAWSIGKMFDKTFGERNAFEKQFVKLFEKILGDKAQSRVVQIERVVQFITTMAKDVIVVRSGKVLLGNIIANLLLLGMNGVRPDVIIKDMLFAWREGQRYGKLQNRLYEIEFALKSARGDERKVLNQERHEIVVDMDKHPMRDYMNAGMMSTIVEDTVIFKDKPDFINIYEEKVKKVMDKIPKPMKDTFDWIVINPNTPVYQFLADATQFSDFGAKYVLAKHLQSKGMSFDRAISEAQESFINYDVPTGQGLDYMNRMGLFMFTKFFLRFQKVLAKLFKDKPAQLIVQHQLLESGLDMQGILDPAMPLRFGNNPFEASAFNIFGTGDDLMTYQVISGAF